MKKYTIDHCRIGSLEIFAPACSVLPGDHCRIGSLENGLDKRMAGYRDHCRIGSLENVALVI